jgi:hypothetical protein
VKSVYRIWDCLAFKHLLTKKGSIEELANGHRFVNEHRGETITFGNEKVPKYPYVTEQLDAMINHARRANDARFLLTYARAVRMVADNKPAKWDLTTQAMVAWWRLHESLGQIPTPKEVKDLVLKEFSPPVHRAALAARRAGTGRAIRSAA